MRVDFAALPGDVRESLIRLQAFLAKELPDVSGVQLTFDELHSEHPPTVDVRER